MPVHSEAIRYGALKIRTQARPGGDPEDVELVVYCPLSMTCLSVEECIACPECRGLRIDPERDAAFLVCRAQSVDGGASDHTIRRLGNRVTVDQIMGRAATRADQPDESISVRAALGAIGVALPEKETVARAAALMASEGLHALPVVDSQGAFAGVLSSSDVLRWLARQAGFVVGEERTVLMKGQPIKNFMTEHPHSIGVEQTLATAHDMMRKHQIRHLPVLHGGKVVGMLSLRDLHLVETLTDVDPASVTVEEAMSAEPYAVGPNTPLQVVAKEMAEHKYGAAIVMDGAKVVGVFTTVDALNALTAALE